MGRSDTQWNGKTARKCIHMCTNQFAAATSTSEECTPCLRAVGPKRALCMSRWACAHEQLWACAHTLMQDEQMSMCSWAWAVMSMCSWAVMSMCSWAVMSMCSYAQRPKLYPTWFWKSNKIYTFPVNWAIPRPWTTSKLAVNTKLKWTCFVTGFRKQKWSVFVTLGFIDFGFIVFHCYNQSITEPIASRSPYFAWGRTILNKGKWPITI
jgi:hypothetical protein